MQTEDTNFQQSRPTGDTSAHVIDLLSMRHYAESMLSTLLLLAAS